MRTLLLLSLFATSTGGFNAQAQTDPPEFRSLEQHQSAERLRVPLKQVMVHVPPFESPEYLASRLGLDILYRYKSDPQRVVLQTKTLEEAETLARVISNWNGFFAAPVHRIHPVGLDFTPDDPYFVAQAGYQGQWHLKNFVNPAIDVNVEPAWNDDVTGLGVTLGIVDDGIEGSHLDLAPNYSPADSWDFYDQDDNPAPEGENRHGVAVSGVAVARGGNSLGVTGVAPFAKLAGLRMGLDGNITSAEIADAVLYRSHGDTRTIQVKNHSYGFTTPFLPDALSLEALETSAQDGTIHCFSAGNSRGSSAQDTGKHVIQNSPWSITVAAIGSTGTWASYSSWGSNVSCTAPSSTAGGGWGVTTTDRSGDAGYNAFLDNDYTSTFGGTSSASPLVAGCMALLKQVAPSANVRVAKHLLAKTCIKVDPNSTLNDGGWKTNAAGVSFNANYGFGLIDASALVALGRKMNVHFSPSAASSGTVNVGATIPDNNTSTGISRTFVVTGPGKVEDVEVRLNVSHTNRGHLAGFLTSPSGLKARFFIASGADSGDDIDWRFLVNHFWGENAAGTWTIQLTDAAAGSVGTWNSFSIKVNQGQLAGTRAVAGRLDLQNWEASSARSVDVEIFNAGQANPILTVPGSVAADGTFTISAAIPDGTYDIAIKTGHWLRKRISGLAFVNGDSIAPQTWSLINGDANQDNVVDILDYVRLAESYNLVLGDTGYDPNTDFNGDESVDLLDYFILSDSYKLKGD